MNVSLTSGLESESVFTPTKAFVSPAGMVKLNEPSVFLLTVIDAPLILTVGNGSLELA